jgi:hypothetical protein
MTALHLIRALDVLREYACALEPARALSSRPVRPFAARPDEKFGLAAGTPIGKPAVVSTVRRVSVD